MGPEAEGTWAKNEHIVRAYTMKSVDMAWNSEFERKQIKDLQFKNLEPVKVRQHGLFGKQYDHSKT